MKDTYLMVNGQKIELTAEQKRQLGIVEEKNCFDRVVMLEYYYINSYGAIIRTDDGASGVDDHLYAVANYCTDKDLLRQRALHETLNRLLWRYSMTHDGDKIDWDNIYSPKYIIYRSSGYVRFDVEEYTCHKIENAVYFKYEQTARDAIEEIIKPFMKEHPDFVW